MNLQFYNVSDFTWKKLLDDSENIKSNFEEYLNGFSNNVKEIIGKFKFKDEINQLDKKDKLFAVLSKMYEVDLHINVVSNNKMGYIYEEMLRKIYRKLSSRRAVHSERGYQTLYGKCYLWEKNIS